jgi:N12 class adenine-specific DNA methylase
MAEPDIESGWDAFPIADNNTPDAGWEQFPEASPPTDGELLGHVMNLMDQQEQEHPELATARWGHSELSKIAGRMPFLGGAYVASKNIGVAKSASRIHKNEADVNDLVNVAAHLRQQKELASQGLPHRVLDSVLNLPGYGTEFAVSGGLYAPARAAATRAIGATGTSVAARVAATVIPRAAGVGATVLASPQLAAAEASRRALPDIQVETNPQGEYANVNVGDDRSFLEALPAGFLDTAIELASERAGGHIVGALAKIPGAARISAMKNAVVGRWLSKPGRTTQMLDETLKQAGWNGVIGEVLEERAGDVARLATGLESPDQNVTGQLGSAAAAGVTGDTKAAKHYARQALEQLAVEGLSFAVPGAMNVAGRGIDHATEPSELTQRLDAIESQYAAEAPQRAAAVPQGKQLKQAMDQSRAERDAKNEFADRMHSLAQEQMQPEPQQPTGPPQPMPWELDQAQYDRQQQARRDTDLTDLRNQNEEAAAKLSGQEREMYRAFYSSPEAAANYVQRFPEQAQQLAALKTHKAEDFAAVDPDLPALTGTPNDAAARRRWKQWVGQFVSDPGAAELTIQAHAQDQLPQNQRDPRSWQRLPPGVPLPNTPAIETRQVGNEQFFRFNPAKAISDNLSLNKPATKEIPELPKTQQIPAQENKPIMAIRLKDGRVISDQTARHHVDVTENHRINPDDVLDTGFVINGKYDNGTNQQPLPDWVQTGAAQQGYDLRPGTATGAMVEQTKKRLGQKNTPEPAPVEPSGNAQRPAEEKPTAEEKVRSVTVRTQSGREINAPPQIRTDTNRKATKDLLAQKQWLLDQAIAEAEARQDDYNLNWMRNEKASNLPPASVDSLNQYLFGETNPEWSATTGERINTGAEVQPQPPVQKSILKPLNPPTQQPEQPQPKRLFTKSAAAKIAYLEKAIKTLNQGRPVAEDMMMNDRGASLRKLEAEIADVQKQLDAAREQAKEQPTKSTPPSVELPAEKPNENAQSQPEPRVEDGSGQPAANAPPVSGEPAAERKPKRRLGQKSPVVLSDAPTAAGGVPERAASEPAGNGAGATDAGESELAGRAAADQGGEVEPQPVSKKSNPVDVNAQNHVIEPDDSLAVRGESESVRRNLTAINLLKSLENQARNATPEEKKTLAQYTGWGGLSQAFDKYKGEQMESGRAWGRDEAWEKKWGKAYKTLKDSLTPEEWEAARDTTINAHYTSKPVIEKMWDIVNRLGFSGGRVLEPGSGIGHFVGLVPARLRNRTDFTLVEMDSLSARIAKKLYPQADVQNAPLQDVRLAPGSVDLVIGNVPFAKEGPADAQKRYQQDMNLHNYFLARALDAVRPGGLVIAISTHNTLDSALEQRQLLASKGDLIGAIRLPNDAFAENAKTEVVTDILIFRRPVNDERIGQPFVKTTEIELPPGTARINEYFAANPDMVLGKQAMAGSMYRKDEYTVLPTSGALPEKLTAAIEKLPAGIATAEKAAGEVVEAKPGEATREGYLRHEGGKVQMAVGGKWITLEPGTTPVEGYAKALFGKTGIDRAKDYIGVRDAYQKLRQTMLDPEASDADVVKGQKALNAAYGKYTKTHGDLNGQRTRIFFGDPEYYRVLSLEDEHVHYDNNTGKLRYSYTKAPVFTKRTLGPRRPPVSVPTVKDGLWVSLGYRGQIDPEYIGQLTGKSRLEVSDNLSQEGLAFRDPSNQQFVLRDRYLSGNVKKKLREAEVAAEDDAAYKPNVEALKNVQPAPVGIAKISVRLGANWIPEDAITAFARQVFDDRGAKAHYGSHGDSWTLTGNKSSVAVQEKWGTARMNGMEILEDALNLRTPRITDTKPTGEVDDHGRAKTTEVFNEKETAAAKAKISEFQKEFRKFIDGNERVADLLEQTYNDKFNAYVDPVYQGSHLELPGASPDIKLRPYQKNAIWRILQDGYALLAHAVGAGKTYTMIGAAMEMRRLGLAKRPILVVQNATLGQFATSFMRMYPNANVLVADKDDLSTNNRQLFLSRITSGDWDSVVMAQSTFDRLANKPDTEMQFIHDQLDLLEELIRDAGGEKSREPSVKDLVRARNSLKKQLDKLLQRERDNRDKNRLYFEDIDADALFLDEAHAYKKPFFITKLENVVGLNKQASARGISTMMKVRHIQGKNAGKNVVLATGTPITNTLGEAWHMVNFVAPHVSQDFGVGTFDGFVGAFAVKDTVREMNAGGQWVFKDALVKFTNGPELLHYLRAGWDILSPDDLKAYMSENESALPTLRTGKVQAVTVDRTPGVEKFMKFLEQVYAKFKDLPGKERRLYSYIPAVAYGAAKSAALDIRLVSPGAKEEPGSKVGEAARLIHEEYERSHAVKGAQLVFSDTFNPRSMATLNAFMAGEEVNLGIAQADETGDDEAQGFLYSELRRKLLNLGIPANEIAIVAEANTDTKREALFELVKSGDVRVMIGSSAKMGVGVNVQNKLVALHHLDAPWLPADIEQREGRIIRFGNENKEVSIYRYAMKNTLDAAIFSKTVRKGKFIWQALAGKVEGREFEDPASELTMSVDEQLAAIEGEPLLFEKMDVDRQKRELELEKEAHSDAIARARASIKEYRHDVERIKTVDIPSQDRFVEKAKALPNGPEVKVGSKTYTDPKEIDEAVSALVKKQQTTVEKATKDELLKQFSPRRWDTTLPKGNTAEPITVNGATATLVTGTVQRMHPDGPKWETESAFRVFLPGENLNLYDGSALTGMGLVQAVQKLSARLEASRQQMDARINQRQKEIADLQNVVDAPWKGQEKLTQLADRLEAIETELVAKSQAKKSDNLSPEQKTDLSGEDTGPTAFGFAGGGQMDRVRPDVIPDQVKADNPEVERQLAAAQGVSKPKLMARIAELSTLTWRAITRSQLHLPNDAQHAAMNEMFRLAKQHAPKAQDEANRKIAAIVDPLGPQQLQLFTRKLILDNLLDSVDRGEPLRFGFKDRAEVQAYKDKLDDLVDGTPEVQEAIKRRRQIANKLVDELIELKLLPEEAKERADTYYHQQVLQYLTVSRLGKNQQITKKGFQKKRVEGVESFDEKLNYNTSYLEAEFEWMRDAYHQIEKEKWLQDLGQRFDIKPELQQFAREHEGDWRDLLRDSKTHRLWRATPGNVFYQAVGVAEHVVEDVLSGLEDTAEVIRDDLRNLLAMGGPQREMVLPNELVDQLDSMQAAKGTDQVNELFSGTSRELLKLWKTWTLFSPLRALAYNIRNLTGDLDPVIGGAPGVLTNTNRAIGELGGYYGIGGKQKLVMSQDLQEARDLAVIDSTLTASEIPDLKDLAIFRRFYSHNQQGVAQMVKGYFDRIKKYSGFRESISRYAAYLYYKEALEKGTLAHYGGAKKETVDALAKDMGIQVAAAHLARNLLGDYGDMTVMGGFLREHVVPFWSWQEINLKRYPQLFVNAALFGPRRGGDKLSQSAMSAVAVGSVALPYILMQLFNRLVWPDDEEKLSDDERASPHLIWGRNPDGSIRILRNTGALGDFLEWFGLNTMLARLDELNAGQMTAQDVAQEMGSDVVNKAVQGLRPDAKAMIELPTGRSTYPNMFSPRSARRDDLLAGYFGLTDAYRELRGRVTDSGARARPNFIARTLGVTDPRKNALFEIIELRDRYLGKLGQDKPYRGNEYFANMREAASSNDSQAFQEARKAYIEHGGDYDKFKRGIAALDPLAAKMKDADEVSFTENYLTPDQREKLGMARDYARKLEVDMWQHWREASKTDSPEVAQKLKDQQLHEAVTLAKQVLARRPTQLTAKEKSDGKTIQEKVKEWQTDRGAAQKRLNESTLHRDEIIGAVRDWAKAELKDPASRTEKLLELRRQMGWYRKLGEPIDTIRPAGNVGGS